MLSESKQIVKIVKKALPAVVSITMAQKLEEPLGVLSSNQVESKGLFKQPKKMKLTGGTGFLIDKTGTIITNRHVVEDEKAEYFVILPSGERVKPDIIARDEINDVAVLSIKSNKSLSFLKLGDSSKLELGQTVIAVGNALGLFQNTVSTGVISGLSREIKAQNENNNQTNLRGLIQTDAAINPGNSGGPLLDLTGKAIGINAAMVFGAENIGFALPINNVKKDLNDLKEHGHIRKPFLGLRYLAINQQIKEELNLPIDKGALIIGEPDITQRNEKQAIVPQSPASKAGLQETDIILSINGEDLTEQKTIADILQQIEVGKALNCKVLRKGKEKTLKIILAEKK